jgi:hypothetical protein
MLLHYHNLLATQLQKGLQKKKKNTSQPCKSAEMILDLVQKRDLVQELHLRIPTRSSSTATAPSAAAKQERLKKQREWCPTPWSPDRMTDLPP